MSSRSVEWGPGRSEPLVVGVTGIHASDNPGPGVGVAKSLKAALGDRVRIVGLAYDAMEPGVFLDEVIDQVFLIPSPTSGAQAWLERLAFVHQQSGMTVVMPNLDSELPFFIEQREGLTAMGLRCFVPQREQFECRAKAMLPQLVQGTTMKAPGQALVHSEAELAQAVSELGFPLMVKGNLYSAYRALCWADVQALYAKVVAQWGFPVIVQACVEGQELNVVGVGDGEGNAPGMVAIKKTSTTSLGKIWTGVSVDHPALLEAAEAFVASTAWRGPFELECMVKDDEVCLIEVNPRFPAWVFFATAIGSNLPLRCVQWALGEEAGGWLNPGEAEGNAASGYATGKMYVRYTEERICDMSRFQQLATTGHTEFVEPVAEASSDVEAGQRPALLRLGEVGR